MEQMQACNFETFFEECGDLSDDESSFDIDAIFTPQQQLSQLQSTHGVCSGRDTAARFHDAGRAVGCRSRSPELKNFAALQAHCNPHKVPSPIRALSPSRACSAEGLAVQAARYSARSSLMIIGVLVALTTAASVPKLTRVDIDKDYSHMMRRDVHTHLVREASRAPSRAGEAEFVRFCERSDAEARCASEYGEDLNIARLRGGETVCDHCENAQRGPDRSAGVLLRGGQPSRQAFKPKLSRTVDDN